MMIERNPQVHNQNEPEVIKALSKHSLYKMLSAKYFLPPRNSRGVSRTYLVGVYTHKYFRIEHIEMKRFMVELTPNLLKKTIHTTKAETHYKIEQLLRETGMKELGFKSGLIPDGVWLYQMARYIDQYNAADIFEYSLSNPINPNANSHKVLVAKKMAEKEEFMDRGIFKDKEIYSKIKELHDSHKRLVSRNLELDYLRKYAQMLMEKIETDKKIVETTLSNATLAVFRHNQIGRQVRPERTWEDEREELRGLTEL